MKEKGSDVCYCGDYRSQHHPWCFCGCEGFRFSRQASKDDQKHWDAYHGMKKAVREMAERKQIR